MPRARSCRTASSRKLVGLDNSLGIESYHPVAAHVISRDPTLWYATIEVDKGSDDGVHVDDPVIGDGGLVGKISTVDPTVSVVTLITDHSMAVAAQVQDAGGDTGVLVPAVGDPNQLLVQDLPQSRRRSTRRSASRSSRPASRHGPLAVAVSAGDPDRHRSRTPARASCSTTARSR